LTGVKLALEADRLLAALRAGRHAQARDLANQISDRAAGIADALAPQPVASPAADVDRSQHANHDQP
jgi:hypothetical protein